MTADGVEIEVGGRTIRISNPGRVYFPARGETKLDLARYYMSVGDGIVRGLRERPCMLHRFPSGVDGPKVHQKRLPSGAPDWVQTVRVHFPRYGRHADELCVTELASVIWAVQMSTVEFHPWNSRRADVECPDEWRIDIDPMPDCPFERVQRVARVVHEVLDELGAVGWPKTSGGRGIHVYVRIEPRWGFHDVRRAALGFAREVQRRAPADATTTWWRKDRDPGKVFVDFNQNARDHTIASAYSVRGRFAGTLAAKGFEERLMRLAPPPAQPEVPGQFWKDFIRDTAPVFRQSTYEQLGSFIAPTWQALLDGARYVDERLAEIFEELAPDAIVEDNVCAFPAIAASGRPWVRIVSCNPLEVKDPSLPPPFSGLPSDDRSEWEGFRDEYARQVGDLQRSFSSFCVQRGAPPLPPLEMIGESPWLNLLLYPEELDYPPSRPLNG